MSKQHLADMLKSMASGDMDAAKDYFSKYSTEKSQEILARNDTPAETQETNEEPTETPETNEEPTGTVEEPTGDDTKE